MNILNVMLGKGKGGLEQVFLDYGNALYEKGFDVLNLANRNSVLDFGGLKSPVLKVRNTSDWDVLSAIRIKALLLKNRPDVIIGHGNRALKVLRRVKGDIPLVAVAHNYSLKTVLKCEYAFALTEHLKRELLDRGFPEGRIFVIGNMADISESADFKGFASPPRIGAMGRFDAEKGFDVYVRALSLLEKEGFPCSAVLAGEGEEAQALQALAPRFLDFPGWVKDKKSFFGGIDVLCVPSYKEAFGLIVLEAFLYGVPVISTRTPGPSELIEDGVNGLLCETGSPEDMARKIRLLLSDEAKAAALTVQAKKTLAAFSSQAVGEKIRQALEKIAPAPR